MARSSNFTDTQKAELFVRDRATCAYTGRNLWLLDHGADPYYEIDWADHIVPVARGGSSTLTNGVCACWSVNAEMRDSMSKHVRIFFGGKPTSAYVDTHKRLATNVKQQLERFARLHLSDWFFNRALFRMWLGVAYLANAQARTRDDLYYARAALKMRVVWARLAPLRTVPSLETRGLTPRRPNPDQKIMLTMRDVDSVEGIRSMMRRLKATYSARL